MAAASGSAPSEVIGASGWGEVGWDQEEGWDSLHGRNHEAGHSCRGREGKTVMEREEVGAGGHCDWGFCGAMVIGSIPRPLIEWSFHAFSGFLPQFKNVETCKMNWTLNGSELCVFECEQLLDSTWPCDELVTCPRLNPASSWWLSHPQCKRSFDRHMDGFSSTLASRWWLAPLNSTRHRFTRTWCSHVFSVHPL